MAKDLSEKYELELQDSYIGSRWTRPILFGLPGMLRSASEKVID